MDSLTLPEPEATIAAVKAARDKLASYLRVTASIQNEIAQTLASGDVAGFANAMGAAKLEEMLTEAALLGAATNRAYRYATQAQSDIVDVSPFADKLAARGKALSHDGTQFVLSDIPQPQTEEPTE